MPIRILIVDEHPLLRRAIRNVLVLEPDFEVVGEAVDGDDAVEKMNALLPDVVLLDIKMPKTTRIKVAANLQQLCPDARILALAIHDDENCMMKLVQAIHRIHSNESFVVPTLIKQQICDSTSQKEEVKLPVSAREIEVLQLVGRGMSNAEIARELFLSEKTVKNHLTNIFRKIQVTDRTQAALYAIKHKIVTVN